MASASTSRENWRALLTARGIAQPPALQTDVAGEINEAYAIEEPLAALLRRHRWHALARSPLNKRIGILRQMAANGDCHDEDFAALLITRRQLAQRGWFN